MSEQTTQEFYLKLSKLFDKDESKEHEKIIALIRVALEKGAQGKMGVFTVCDVLEDYSPEKLNKTLH